VEARTERILQATVGIVLLTAFVFRLTLVVPALALLLVPAAIAGPERHPLGWLFERLVAPRLPAPTGTAIDRRTVQAQDMLAVGLLAIASLAFLVDVGAIGWLIVVLEAVIAIVAATTMVHAGDQLRRFTG
jgi:hypothetical protein